MRQTISALAGLAALCATLAARGGGPGFAFTDVGPARGILPYVMANGDGGGVAAADYDDDGDIDLFVPTAEGLPDQLYRNLGDGTFEEVAIQVGLLSFARSRVALWFDYDGDHQLDLFVAGDCYNAAQDCPNTSTLHLWRQVSPDEFEDVTLEAGIPDDLVTSTTSHRGGMCAGDINGDGYLDLLFSLWFGRPQLLLNDGDGTFTAITQSAGLNILGNHWQPVMLDFNGDGRLDIYHAIDFNVNHLWINQGDETFVDFAGIADADSAWNDMGVTLGDYDNDGDFDIYVTNIESTSRHNILYRNDTVGGVPHFTEVSQALGVDSGYWGWGAQFFDADNDGDVDLAATNGFSSPPNEEDPSRFFLNNGGGTPFSDVSDAVGFNDTYWGSAVIAIDYDRDGDLDIVQTCNGSGTGPNLVRVLENNPTTDGAIGNWLCIKPRMAGPNHRAIGAVVRVTTETDQMARVITAGTSFFGQEPAEAFFGLGQAASALEIIVEWPDGQRTVRRDVGANQQVTVSPKPGDVTGDGAVDFADILAVLAGWGPCPPPPEYCLLDQNADGVVGFADLLVILGNWDP